VTSTGGHLVENVDEHELIAHATEIAESAAGVARAVHPALDVNTRVEDRPAEVTLIEASKSAGLVVVGTRGRGIFQAMVLGSVSHAVIHGADATVAVVDVGQA
jgi:nucleotide-binding universal stress UspA family protein